MLTPLVMTVIGPDRTGLVESIARIVAEHGGNWLESRMSRLGGEFGFKLRVGAIDPDRDSSFGITCDKGCSRQLSPAVEEASPHAAIRAYT